MPQKISQFVLVMTCWSLTVYSGHGLSSEVHLKMLDKRVCIGEQFHLSCQHPDLANASAYLLGSPVWKEDGSILTLDGDMYTTYLLSRRQTVLTVSATWEHFANTSHTYTCSVAEAIPGISHGQTIISNAISIHPLVLPRTPTFNDVETGASTANLSWSHDSTCFEECHFEYILTVTHYHSSTQSTPYWIRVNITQYLLSNLHSGTPYVVMLNAFCTSKSVWSATVSTNFTTVSEQRDKGISALFLAGVITAGAVLLLIMSCIIVAAGIIWTVYCCKWGSFANQGPVEGEQQEDLTPHVQMQTNPCYEVIHHGPEVERNEHNIMDAHTQMVENPSYIYNNNSLTTHYQNVTLRDKLDCAIYEKVY